MIIRRFWVAVTGVHVLGSVAVSAFWPQFSRIFTPSQANGNCSFWSNFGRLLLMIVALLETMFVVVYQVVYAAVAYLYAQNSEVSINWLAFATMVFTGCIYSMSYAWDSAQKKSLASTRKHVQQQTEDCQWILWFDDKIRYPLQLSGPQNQYDAKLIAYMEFVEKQNLVHDQELKANIQPFLTARHQAQLVAINWNADYEHKAGQLCTWLGKIEAIVEGTDECVKILTSEDDKRLLLGLKIAYYNVCDVVCPLGKLPVTITDQTNANWNTLRERLRQTLHNREELYTKASKTSQKAKTSTSDTLVGCEKK
jgi:hypothetical protein